MKSKKKTGKVFLLKLAVSAMIICAAVVVKVLPGDSAREFINEHVNGGLDYKEAVQAVGKCIDGKDDIISVFNSIDGKKSEEKQQEKAEETKEKKEEVPKTDVDEDFYAPKPQSPVVESAAVPTDESKEALAISFDMSAAELADDTKPVVFQIPPPSTCSYEKIAIEFKHTTPVYGVMTSKYGYRDHPLGGNAGFHTGIDIGADSGTAVQAFADGTVLESDSNDIYGNYVLLQHADGIRTFYGHNSKLVVKKGQRVRMGQKISEVGTTGMSTGPHLHFEVRSGKIRHDPKYYISLERI
ncbi:MAG: M23 family metallopeptidase [Clostridia bacterium]